MTTPMTPDEEHAFYAQGEFRHDAPQTIDDC